MAKLYFSLDGNALGEFTLNKERITIGRRPTNDIHIDHLAISGEHAIITTIAGDSFLEDLNSTNGTVVNKKTVKKHVLYHADVIEFGKYQLRFENIAQSKVSKHGFENTAVMQAVKPSIPSATSKETVKLAANKTPQVSLAKQVTPPAAVAHNATLDPNNPSLKQARLQVLSGASSGTELLLNKALTTLGESNAQVAVIMKRPHGYFLSHVKGSQLPYINGQQLGLQAHQLVNNDVIEMANAKMKFYLV